MVYSFDAFKSCQKQMPDGQWVPCKPMNAPFFMELRFRVKAALAVLRGQAAAVRWY